MTTYKIGDEVWFFYTECGRYSWHETCTVIYPDSWHIQRGVIVNIDPDKDSIHVYVQGDTLVCNFGYTFHTDYFYKTKHAAIDALVKRIQDMKNG